ncbi:MAG TPA: MFS transporter [Symbiobacteriaceae bacterium]|jgi:MFS family permease|nr:MFS transporter [Symbiobacteriaceae bacterium]
MQRIRERFAGLGAFSVVWFGQLISFMGTGMSRFALTVWAWQATGSATALGAVAFFSYGATVAMTPFAGVIVDRFSRKKVMIVTDLGAGLASVGIFLLYLTGHLQVWHLCAAGVVSGAFESLQFPAWSAAISTMVSKEHYARANGMMSILDAAAQIVPPVIGGALVALMGIGGVLTIDIITFLIAVGLVLIIPIPDPEKLSDGPIKPLPMWKDAGYGFKYIWERPSLLGLQLVFMAMNMMIVFHFVLFSLMVLARTGDNTQTLGVALSAAGIGTLLGGMAMTTWGGPKRRVYGVLGGMVLVSTLGWLVSGIGQALPWWVVGSFFSAFFLPIINGSNQAIWQAKVGLDVQGRVFAARRLISQIAGPLAMLSVGPLADYVFEPMMAKGGALAGVFGGLLGTGPGAGMGLLMFLAGLTGVVFASTGYLFPAVRNAETILPDHDQKTASA